MTPILFGNGWSYRVRIRWGFLLLPLLSLPLSFDWNISSFLFCLASFLLACLLVVGWKCVNPRICTTTRKYSILINALFFVIFQLFLSFYCLVIYLVETSTVAFHLLPSWQDVMSISCNRICNHTLLTWRLCFTLWVTSGTTGSPSDEYRGRNSFFSHSSGYGWSL